MPAQVVFSPYAPSPPPFLSQAISVGDLVFCSGQVGINPQSGVLIQGSVGDRTKQILLNLGAVLQSAGCGLENVVKTNIYLTNLGDFSEVNDVYTSFFRDQKPARTCVGVKELPLRTDVEIECIANKRTVEIGHL